VNEQFYDTSTGLLTGYSFNSAWRGGVGRDRGVFGLQGFRWMADAEARRAYEGWWSAGTNHIPGDVRRRFGFGLRTTRCHQGLTREARRKL